jgi:hypothetical protein
MKRTHSAPRGPRIGAAVALAVLFTAGRAGANLRLNLAPIHDGTATLSDAERAELEKAVRDGVAASPEKLIVDADGVRAPADGTMLVSVDQDAAGKKLVVSIEVRLANGEVWRVQTPDPTPTGLSPSPVPPPSPLPHRR